MCKVLCAILILASSFQLGAQSFYAARRERSLILTGGIGTSTYLGDLANKNIHINAKPNINIGLQYYFSNRASVRAEVNWFTLAGDDKDANDGGRDQRNLSFESSNFELSTVGMVNLYANGNRYYRRPSFNIYGFAGVALLYTNPKALYQGEWIALQPLKTEGVSYSLFQPVIPFGIGARLKIGPRMNITVEGGWRKTFTDYLDDVSSVYPADPKPFLSDRGQEIARPWNPGDKRGDPKNDDSYNLLNVKIEYYLPYDVNKRGSSGLRYNKKRKANYRYSKKGGVRKKGR